MDHSDFPLKIVNLLQGELADEALLLQELEIPDKPSVVLASPVAEMGVALQVVRELERGRAVGTSEIVGKAGSFRSRRFLVNQIHETSRSLLGEFEAVVVIEPEGLAARAVVDVQSRSQLRLNREKTCADLHGQGGHLVFAVRAVHHAHYLDSGFGVTIGRLGCVFGARAIPGGSMEGPGISENNGTKVAP